MVIIEHTTNPEFKCVQHVIKIRFISMPTRVRDGERCTGVSDKTTTSVRARGLQNRARDSEAVQGFEAPTVHYTRTRCQAHPSRRVKGLGTTVQ